MEKYIFYLVVSKEISFCEFPYVGINFEVVEDVDALNVTETVVQNTCQLREETFVIKPHIWWKVEDY